MTAILPPKEVERRHKAAMKLVKLLPEPDRVLMLSYVVWGSEKIRELEEKEAA